MGPLDICKLFSEQALKYKALPLRWKIIIVCFNLNSFLLKVMFSWWLPPYFSAISSKKHKTNISHLRENCNPCSVLTFILSGTSHNAKQSLGLGWKQKLSWKVWSPSYYSLQDSCSSAWWSFQSVSVSGFQERHLGILKDYINDVSIHFPWVSTPRFSCLRPRPSPALFLDSH